MDNPTDDQIREACDIVIAHLEHEYGFCKESDGHVLGCASCQAEWLRQWLESVKGDLGNE